MSKEFKDYFKGKEISFGDMDVVATLQTEIKKITQALCDVGVIGSPNAFITDESLLGDFCMEADELEKLQIALNIPQPLSDNMLVVEVAVILKQIQTGKN